MTFEQFQTTRQLCDDLGDALADARWEGGPKATGFLYLGALFIEDVADHWPEGTKAEGKHYLIIGNQEWISNDLKALERRLYDFAVGEGYTIE